MTPRELILQISARLKAAGVPDPTTDSALMLSRLTERPPLELRMDMETEITASTLAQMEALAQRRCKREPLQYILGEAPFFGRMFEIAPGALIPRPETEELCRWALEQLEPGGSPSILDLCAGSGCIGLTMKLERPEAEVTLAELSDEAIRTAERNRDRFGADARILKSDLFSAVAGKRFDLILSNPPYIPSGECPGLQREVLYEPLMALDGGADGLAFYQRIAAEAGAFMKAGGCLMMELGDGEAGKVKQMLAEAGWRNIEVRQDLAGKQRMIRGEAPEGEEHVYKAGRNAEPV